MTRRMRVPHQLDPGVVIRPPGNDAEIAAANELVFRSYVAEGYWDDDIGNLTHNKWLHSSFRKVFVAVYGHEVVATVSLIRDSEQGLPSDCFQPELLDGFRRVGDRLAEVSALAVRTESVRLRNLPLYLMCCYMQYSFYHSDATRLVKSCRPNHANFYSNVLRFEKLSPVSYNSYARTAAQFISIDLQDAHRVLSEYYETEGVEKESFYRFLMVAEHSAIKFPDSACRPRHRDWVALARIHRYSTRTNRVPAHSEKAYAAHAATVAV